MISRSLCTSGPGQSYPKDPSVLKLLPQESFLGLFLGDNLTRLATLNIKNNLENAYSTLSGFKKALLQDPPEMIRGPLFSEMIRIQAQKSELQAESRSYGPKSQSYSRAEPQNPNRITRKGPRMGFRCFCRKPPLKPS